jgi:exopolysaccharide production protein ExoQ
MTANASSAAAMPSPRTALRPLQRLADPRRRIAISVVLDWIMSAFMVYVFVGGQLFEDRSPESLAENFANQGQGDTFRQIYYFTIFVIVAFITYRRDFLYKIRYYPMTINLMTVWCLMTAFAAIEPMISFRRLVLSSIVLYTTFNLFICIGYQRSFQLLRNVLAFLMIVSLLSVFIVPEAVHPPTERDQALAGAWKGLFFHKNIAASMAANAIIVFVFSYLNHRKVFDLFLIAVSLVFLSGTLGKTAPVLLVVALSLGFFYRYALGHPKSRTSYVAANALFIAGLATAILFFQDPIIRILSDPESLTGRIAIWNLVTDYVAQYPLTGAGYGSFWQIGGQSPVHRLTSVEWLIKTSHSHSGYLELMATTGVPGLFLGLLALVFVPFVAFMNLDATDRNTKAALYAIWIFALLFNFMETQIFTRDRQIWLMLIIVIASLRCMAYEKGARR